jgi:hypothetical protein
LREYQKENSFLKHLIAYKAGPEHQFLRGSIERAERNERSVLRAVRVVILLAAISGAGLAYSALLLDDIRDGVYEFLIMSFSALGLTSLACLPIFFVLWLFHRIDCNERREECRHVIVSLLAERLGDVSALSPNRVSAPAATTQKTTASNQTKQPVTVHIGEPLTA